MVETSKAQALQSLRARCTDRYSVNQVREDGIYLTRTFRYDESAREFAAAVLALGGDAYRMSLGKGKGYRVEFSVGIDEDLYLAGRINFATFREMQG